MNDKLKAEAELAKSVHEALCVVLSEKNATAPAACYACATILVDTLRAMGSSRELFVAQLAQHWDAIALVAKQDAFAALPLEEQLTLESTASVKH